uniref:Uncharacterized protein n=1 Tax=Thermogemmatispora argillosa TaxID=2045280 RepID=A0A455T3L8_9CHLR|nr:hypothetical protein KTA_26190 [Thermogemmatispora argillosa]
MSYKNHCQDLLLRKYLSIPFPQKNLSISALLGLPGTGGAPADHAADPLSWENSVTVDDRAGVLDVARVKSAGEKPPYPLVVSTTNCDFLPGDPVNPNATSSV